MPDPVLRTERLILRRLRPDDMDAFAAMNADPEVMRYFPACLSRAETEALAARMDRHVERHGFGWWAVEAPGVAPFVGFVGLMSPAFHAAFTPCVEVGWRLVRAAWGRGYATEAGQASVDFAFETLGLGEIVSMAVADNHPSRRVMERLGMRRRPADDFGHPKLPFGHPLRHHVLYRLSRADWAKRRSGPLSVD
ncbi:MAG: GNAT family N-acetyltransferase [Alphaproteobacteria bacterium]